MCLFIVKAGRWSWKSKSATPPPLDKKLSLSNKSFSKCNFVDICDDAVIKGSFSYRWGGKILLLLEVNGECREWRMPWAENAMSGDFGRNAVSGECREWSMPWVENVTFQQVLFSKCNFLDICDDAVIKGPFSYRWLVWICWFSQVENMFRIA